MAEAELQLEREGAQRQTVAVSAVVAGVLLFGGSLYGAVAIESKSPTVGLFEGLAPALRGQPRAAVDPHTATLIFVNHHSAGLVAATVIIGLGSLAMILLLRYLFAAARLRRPELTNVAEILAVAGPAAAATLSVAAEIVYAIDAHRFVMHHDRSHHAVTTAMNSTAHAALSIIATAGQLAIAFAFVMIAMNAMRVGLVTRFMGVLGIISGALFIIPLFPLPVVQTFWLVGMGVILGGWAGNPLPPAWAAGEARPWPSQQELREARERQRAGAARTKAPPPEPTAPSKPSPATSTKRKRKRH
jgi:hypothetical protein